MRRAMMAMLGCVGVMAASAGVRAGEEEAPEPVEPRAGTWTAWLESPGGRLAFGLVFSRDQDGVLGATIANGADRIAVPTVRLEGDELTLGFDHYDSRIVGTVSEFGKRIDGTWTKVGRGGEATSLGFRAVESNGLRVAEGGSRDVRYSVWFEESGPAVGEFAYFSNGVVHGTFRTPTGDFGYLGGFVDSSDRLTLSCFDGAHAFLFKARGVASPEYDLRGEFWSGATWHEVWRAKENPDAALPDAWTQTAIAEESPDLSELVFTSLDGQRVSLASLKKDDRPMIVELFGTWCPNCHDEAKHLSELARTYDKAGLVVVGLAFELTDDLERSRRQIERYRDRYDIGFPLLIGGKADKATVAERVPMIDRMRSYPTTIFIDAKGKVRGVYTGYSGPATGAAHEELRKRFDAMVRTMLDEVIK